MSKSTDNDGIELRFKSWANYISSRPSIMIPTRTTQQTQSAALEGYTPVWRHGKYAVYKATEDMPLPPGIRCMSRRELLAAIAVDPGDEVLGLMKRGGLTSGYAKYIVDDIAVGENELGKVGL